VIPATDLAPFGSRQFRIPFDATGKKILDKLMADARQRRFDAVLVLKLDRFGRSLVSLRQRHSGTFQRAHHGAE
jgi:hypothetical protein